MASSVQSAMNSLAAYIPGFESTTQYSEIYEANCHKIYSLAFWMTDNELAAEELSSNTFLRAFANVAEPTTEQIDRAFLAEIRELTAVGTLTLDCSTSSETQSIYGNIKRVHLERALVQLPAT